MPEQQTTTTPPADDPTAVPAPGTEQDSNALAKARREAAGYRTKLREAEETIARQSQRLDRVDREDVERTVAEKLVDPSDFWTMSSLDAVRDDSGEIDAERVAVELDRIVEAKPHWARHAQVAQGARMAADAGPGDPLKRPGQTFGERLKSVHQGS